MTRLCERYISTLLGFNGLACRAWSPDVHWAIHVPLRGRQAKVTWGAVPGIAYEAMSLRVDTPPLSDVG